MKKTSECRLCGRRFRPRAGGLLRYCARCGKKADREISRVHRPRCGECGLPFKTPRRSVVYCSSLCQKRASARRRRSAMAASAASPPLSRPRPPPRHARTAKCRVCGRAFPSNAILSRPPVYCSHPCRAEGRRARMREYMRRYLADPEKRAVHAARLRASSARRSAMYGRNRAGSAQCKQCGADLAPNRGRRVLYCSDPCRKKGRARAIEAYRQRERAARAEAAATARCRVCAREFAPSAGPGRPRTYCSDGCRAEGRRAYARERALRRRGRGSSGAGG